MSNINQINSLLKKLFPITRSLTGIGNIQTFLILKNILPSIKIQSIKSGTKVFDWKVPNEWHFNDAFIKNKYGKKIVNIKKNNLHLIGYSKPFKGIISKKELLPHLYFLKKFPSWIPYRTSYYSDNWGFCVPYKLLKSKDFVGPFEVCIDTSFNKRGKLVYAEDKKKGSLKEEIIISTYCCHPSLANDNLSGLITAVLLFEYIRNQKTRKSYRLLIAPETIGVLCFLKKSKIKNISAGTVITTTGGPDLLSIKDAYDIDHWINKVTHLAVSKFTNNKYIKYPFKPDGSDERQFASPGVRIPTPSIHKSKYYEYKEYHTSADNLNFVKAKYIQETLSCYIKWFHYVDSHCYPLRKQKVGEYQLGKRGLYPKIGGSISQKASTNLKNQKIKISNIKCFGWIMHLADGTVSNIGIAERSGIDIETVNESIDLLFKKGLILK